MQLSEADKIWLNCLPADQKLAGVAFVKWKTLLYPDVTVLPPGQIFMEAFELGRGIKRVMTDAKAKARRNKRK
jgi:hypothetical protein